MDDFEDILSSAVEEANQQFQLQDLNVDGSELKSTQRKRKVKKIVLSDGSIEEVSCDESDEEEEGHVEKIEAEEPVENQNLTESPEEILPNSSDVDETLSTEVEVEVDNQIEEKLDSTDVIIKDEEEVSELAEDVVEVSTENEETKVDFEKEDQGSANPVDQAALELEVEREEVAKVSIEPEVQNEETILENKIEQESAEFTTGSEIHAEGAEEPLDEATTEFEVKSAEPELEKELGEQPIEILTELDAKNEENKAEDESEEQAELEAKNEGTEKENETEEQAIEVSTELEAKNEETEVEIGGEGKAEFNSEDQSAITLQDHPVNVAETEKDNEATSKNEETTEVEGEKEGAVEPVSEIVYFEQAAQVLAVGPPTLEEEASPVENFQEEPRIDLTKDPEVETKIDSIEVEVNSNDISSNAAPSLNEIQTVEVLSHQEESLASEVVSSDVNKDEGSEAQLESEATNLILENSTRIQLEGKQMDIETNEDSNSKLILLTKGVEIPDPIEEPIEATNVTEDAKNPSEFFASSSENQDSKGVESSNLESDVVKALQDTLAEIDIEKEEEPPVKSPSFTATAEETKNVDDSPAKKSGSGSETKVADSPPKSIREQYKAANAPKPEAPKSSCILS